jgi:hypothetical protein
MDRLALSSSDEAALSPRHCKRSEAIHGFRVGRYGLLRRFAPLYERFAFVAGNDGELQIGNALTKSGLVGASR